MITESEKYLRTWILEFLDKPQSLLNGFPTCPYARHAKIRFIEVHDYVKSIEENLDDWNDTYEVICFVCEDADPDKFVEDVANINKKYMPRGFVCLEDHKEIPETFHHLDFRNGRYNIILVQKLEKINEAGKKLLDKGYYKNWTEEMYDNVVAWRSQRP